MDSTSVMKQILDANKKVFEDSLNAMMIFQEHAEKMTRIFWERSAFFPLESRKAVDEWLNHYKESLDDFKVNVDKRFKLMEYYLLNATDQMASSMQTVVDKTVPASQVYEVTKKPAARGKQKDDSVSKTVKKKKLTIKDK